MIHLKRLLFFINIRWFMVAFLGALLGLAVVLTGRWIVLAETVVVLLVYSASDVVLKSGKISSRSVPVTALISGLILVSVLSPTLPVWVWVVAPLIASASKRLLRFGGRHVFNPAAFSIVVLSFFVPGLVGWWVGGTHPLFLVVLSVGALYVWWRLKKWRTVVAFFLAYYVLLVSVASIDAAIPPWRDPTLLFFTGVMLIEPITTAFRHKHVRIFYGAAVGALPILFGFVSGFPVDLLLAAILAGNLFGVLTDQLYGRLKSHAKKGTLQPQENS